MAESDVLAAIAALDTLIDGLITKVDLLDTNVDSLTTAVGVADTVVDNLATTLAAVKAQTDKLAFDASNHVASDLHAIDGALTTGNNAMLTLKQLSIINSAGDAIVATGGGAGHGINATAGATANYNGIRATGGAGGGEGAYFVATGSAKAGLRAYGASGPGILATGGTDSVGISFVGNGTGAGILSTGGATGDGLRAAGGATSGHGIFAYASAVGAGIKGNGAGTGAGSGNSAGVQFTGAGSGAGLHAIAGATGSGLKAEATSGDGISTTGANGGRGIYAAGANGGQGILAVAGVTGDGIKALGGATSGAGINATVGAGNLGDGILAIGAGSGKADINADITGNITGTVSTVTTVTNDVGITQSAADKVWGTTTRTLSSFGTLVSDTAAAVWAATTRTLSAFGFTVATNSDTNVTNIKTKTANLPSDTAATLTSLQSSINGISNVTRLTTAFPQYFTRPNTGTTIIKMECAYKNSTGLMDDPDNNELMLAIYNFDPLVNKNSKLYKNATATQSLDTSSISGYMKLEKTSTGLYFCYYKLESTDTAEELIAKFTWLEGTQSLFEFRGFQVVDFTNDLSAIASSIDELHDFDPANDVVARVTLVDTTTTNTDMRGTNDAFTLGQWPESTATSNDVISAVADVQDIVDVLHDFDPDTETVRIRSVYE